MTILTFALAALIAAVIGAFERRRGAIFAAGGLIVFLAAAIAMPTRFLDQTYYLMMAALIVLLFALQIRLLGVERQAKEKAALQAVRLRHELLKKQIQPHFLMNTLTTLAEWIESDPKTGVKMIDALSGELRMLYDISDEKLIPLDDELELCRRHLNVMSLRADADFTLRVNGAPEGLQCPPALLLTLLENAFTHNEYRDDAEFEFEARVSEGNVFIACSTPIRPAPSNAKKTGAGLAYVRMRLKEAFGDAWTMRSERRGDVWATEISWNLP